MNYKIFYSSDEGSFVKAITYGYKNPEDLVIFIDTHRSSKSTIKFFKDSWKMISKKRKKSVECRIFIYCNVFVHLTKKDWEEYFKNIFKKEFDVWFPKAKKEIT